jgi:hypothetical protein
MFQNKMITLNLQVIDKTKEKEILTKWGYKRHSQAICKNGDETIILNLWGEQVDKVVVGDKIIVTGYIIKIKGQSHLNVPRNGKIFKVKL